MMVVMLLIFTGVLYFTDFAPHWTAVVPIVFLLYLPLVRVYWVLRIFRSNPALFSETTLEFNEEYLTFENELGNSRIPWKAFIKGVICREYFELYLSELNVVMIPKRAFSTEDLERFEITSRQVLGHKLK
jgi:hypothetical protein